MSALLCILTGRAAAAPPAAAQRKKRGLPFESRQRMRSVHVSPTELNRI